MEPLPPQPLKLSFVSSPAYLPVVRSAVEQFSRLIGFGEESAGGIMLAVDEALANIIEHAYDGREDRSVEVALSARLAGGTVDGLCVELRDYGRVVDARVIRGRALDDVRPGGLGVHIMRSCMDSVEYTHPGDGGTLLRMVKRLTTGRPQGSDKTISQAGEHRHG